MRRVCSRVFACRLRLAPRRRHARRRHAPGVTHTGCPPARPACRFTEAIVAPVAPGNELELKELVLERAYEKGQSKRIWGELYKVLDSSDVIIEVGGRGGTVGAPGPAHARGRSLPPRPCMHAASTHLVQLSVGLG